MKTLDYLGLKSLLESKEVHLIEALPEEYFQRGHLPGALNIPLNTDDSTLLSRLDDKDVVVVTYCTGVTCPNSKRLAQRLVTLGFQSVYVFEGGKDEWLKNGNSLQNSLREVES